VRPRNQRRRLAFLSGNTVGAPVMRPDPARSGRAFARTEAGNLGTWRFIMVRALLLAAGLTFAGLMLSGCVVETPGYYHHY